MAFKRGSIAEKYTSGGGTSGGFQRGSISGKYASKSDLKTTAGLYQKAVESGLQKEADEVLKKYSGEKTKEIFSGGFISDVFDGLNALQYGVVGMLKGKTFIEGVKQRESFSDKDALGDKGLPGVVAGIALDIAFDPLTYIAPATVVKKVPVLGKALKAAKEAVFGKRVLKTVETAADAADKVSPTYMATEGGTRLGKYLASKLSWSMGKDPMWLDTITRGQKNIAASTKGIVDMGKVVAKLDKDTASKILVRNKGGALEFEDLGKLRQTLDPNAYKVVEDFSKTIDDLGEQAVNLGMLSEKTWKANKGKYVKRVFEEYELMKTSKGFLKKFGGAGRAGIKGGQFGVRKDAFGAIYRAKGEATDLVKKFETKEARDTFVKSIKKDGGKVKETFAPLSPEKLKELGEIEQPAYVLTKTAFDLMRDVENGKILREVSQKFGVKSMDNAVANGFEQIPNTKKWGDLAGMYVPKYMADMLNPMIEPAAQTLGKQTVANFKFFKVIMNPGTHVRNIISNRILNWWKLGMNPLDPRTMKAEAIATKEIFKGSGKWTKEATKHGYDLNTFAANEIPNLLDHPTAAQGLSKMGKGWQTIKKKLGDIYQAEENHAKLAAYIFNRQNKKLLPDGKGGQIRRVMTESEAWRAAESATFNYAQVTPFVRKLRESLFGFPFVTFTVKATPAALETAYKYPRRISSIGKIKNGIEKLSDIEETDRERATEAPWIRDGFYIKLPIKDKHGRSAYFDLTYIIPFGDLMSGNFGERRIDPETGVPEGQATSLLRKSPFFNLVTELGKNRDFYGNKIWKDTDSSEKQLGDLSRHLMKTYLPPLAADQLPGGYNDRGERQWRGVPGALQPKEDIGTKRTLTQELLRNTGMKVQPIDADVQEQYQDWNQRKALRNLLLENFGETAVKEFESLYIPKDLR